MKSTIKILLFNLFLTTMLVAQNDEFGIVSYYSDLFHGKPTASGDLYDKAQLTAAHKTLPFGTMVKVTDLENNKSVQVRINDRGPFISGRILELSRAAASQIGLIEKGVTRAQLEIVKTKAETPVVADATKPDVPKSQEQPVEKIETKPPATTTSATTPKSATAAVATSTPDKLKINEKPAKGTVAEPVAKAKEKSTSKSVLVKDQDYTPVGLYEIALKRPEAKGFGVQVASLTTQNALFKKIAELQGDWFDNIIVNVEKGKGDNMVYKIILGTYATEGEAAVYKANLKKNKKIDGFVVNLASFAPTTK